MKINKKTIYGLGAIGAIVIPTGMAVVSCGDKDSGPTESLDKITSQQVQETFKLKNGDGTVETGTVKQPVNLLKITINNINDVDLNISKWDANKNEGTISFTATATKKGLTSKNIDIMLTGYKKHINVTLTQANKDQYTTFDNDGGKGELTIHNDVDIIGDGAFHDGNWINGDVATVIKTLVFESNSILTTIGQSSFSLSTFTSLTIPDSVATIGDSAFLRVPIVTLILNNSLKTIGTDAFYMSSLISLIIPDSVTTIGISAFREAKLKKLIIPDSATTMGDHAFFQSPLETLIFKGDIPTAIERKLTIGDTCFGLTPIINIKDGPTHTAAEWQAWATTNARDAFQP